MLRILGLIAIVSTLSACVGMTAGARKHSMTAQNGNMLQLAQYSCRVTAVEYRNDLAVPTHQQAFQVVATDTSGVPRRQWTAYCGATPPNSKSDCLVHEDLGTGLESASLICSDYRRFALMQ